MNKLTKVISAFLFLFISGNIISSNKEINSFSAIYTAVNDNSINPQIMYLGLMGFRYLIDNEQIANDSLLVLIDYTKPSYNERLYIINVKSRLVLYKSLVAHGKNSGDTLALNFSNKKFSNMSSLGFFATGETYSGKHGYSLRIDGLEPGINDKARDRNIVIHAAKYVNPEFVEKYGRAGRSFGCPALPEKTHRHIINLIKNGVCVFAFGNTYLESLNNNAILEKYLNNDIIDNIIANY